jgi:steroid 5-alpha reductase family enzyme
MAVHVLDNYYLAITLLITIAYQLIAFSIAFSLKFDKITDFAGGTNFVLVALLTLGFASNGDSTVNARQIVASLFLAIWAARLSGFLLFRILKTGKDDRFDDKRDKFFPFLGFFVFQMIWVWLVSMPVTLLNSPNVNQYQPRHSFGTGNDIAGVIMWAMGFGIESVADVQKYRFRMNSANNGKVCDKGFFSWSRHPNYAGEILTQFAIYTMCLSPVSYGDVPSGSGAYAALYASIVGPLFLTILLLFVSGLTLQERPGAKKKYEKSGPNGQEWLDYKRYTERTSILIPIPSFIYAPLPLFIKRTLLLEWPMYRFDPEKHADQSKVRDRQAEEGRGSESTAVDRSENRQASNGSKDGLVNGQR